ncbi:MAG: cellulose synthase/poly-beta-1,6-N-acetylglucosamine synthase-like glycosyltransferase [Saprospiraceae bacterium]
MTGVLHTYLFYPLIIKWLTGRKKLNEALVLSKKEVPPVFILMAVYNEEKVIRQKLKSIFETNYPLEKIWVFIGSDNSTDATNSIIEEFQATYPQLKYTNFGGRNGKIRIINQLFEHQQKLINQHPDSVLVLTDANVFFTPDMLSELTQHFQSPQIGLVGANVLNIDVKDTGISLQEQFYVQRENVIKHYESEAFGAMMGAFGACYALRAKLFLPVPTNFIVDDFFQTMHILDANFQTIKALKAICYEDVSEDIFEEYRRKKRISAGNFQNLKYFSHLLFKWDGVAFAFWSHKVLRWLSPFFIIAAFVCSYFLKEDYLIYKIAFCGQLFLFTLPFFDRILNWLTGKQIKVLRFVTYFYLMNIALLIGFFNYAKGINSNIWKPTKRN